MRYIVGIDLGTTNSSVSYVDTKTSALAIQQYRIPQLVAEGVVKALPTLPSYCYLTAPGEWHAEALRLPWKTRTSSFVGTFALEHGAKVPSRLVSSAKSWLCHQAANRQEKILPFDALTENERISPVEASKRYLDHIRLAWNDEMAKGDVELELEQQEILLTVPASFDEVARALTAQAAKEAGFLQVTFLEEPQAAFYSWMASHSSWKKQFQQGDLILVCDVGGGTTDFSLIEVIEREGGLTFSRSSVGDHLLLGGDNLDAALAYFLKDKIEAASQISLSTLQWKQLYHEARKAKELLLEGEGKAPESVNVAIQGTGSHVIQGSMTVQITQQEIASLLVDGFFGVFPWQEAIRLKQSSGMRTMGLPYEDDPSITKQLAHFLHLSLKDLYRGPKYLLFNGGTMKAPAFQQRILENLRLWFPHQTTHVLESSSLDLAVSRGAVYFGKARRGFGTKIQSGSPRSYYLELHVDQEKKALCLLPRGCEEGASYEPETRFLLTANQPVVFTVLTSHGRLGDQSGEVIEIVPEEMHKLPPIATILRFGKQGASNGEQKIPVHLGIRYTSIGTLELWLQAQGTPHRWNLEFQLKNAAGHDDQLSLVGQTRKDETFDDSYLVEPKSVIKEFFKRGAALQPDQVMGRLEETLLQPRQEWSSSVLRGLWGALLECAEGRSLSASHGARWWNLAGYFLRPGAGHPLDDFRMQELWKIVLSDLNGQKSKESLLQNWICLRRVAAGLKKGQQMQIAHQLLPSLINKKSGKMEKDPKMTGYHYTELIRVLGALELIDQAQKIKLGEALLDKIVAGHGVKADFWTLGRLGARHLAYGSAPHLLPQERAAGWIEGLLPKMDVYGAEALIFVLTQLARVSEHKECMVPEEIRRKIYDAYKETPYLERIMHGISEVRPQTREGEEELLGEELPPGLSLCSTD